MKKLLSVGFALLFSFAVFAQRYTISGYVEDAETGERLINSNVYNQNNLQQGTVTNVYGFYSLTLPKSTKIKLTASFVGYTSVQSEFVLNADTVINIKLLPSTQLEDVVVTGERNNVESTQMSVVDIPIETINSLPALLGEVDVLKTVQLLPGVQSGSEGTSGFYVRGGGPDQNLILLDGVPVYNVNHLFGFFSVFNGYAISDVSLIKGGFPARYGGRLSSVLDIRMKEGNMNRYTGEFSTGIIASKFTFEGPIVKNKSSFIISGRRTYIDALAAPIMAAVTGLNPNYNKFYAGYYFYDLNAKLNYKFSDKDRIFLSGYLGRDKAYTNISENWDDYKSETKFNLNWGNVTSALRWNHVFTPKLFANTTLTYSNYNFVIDIENNWEYKSYLDPNETIKEEFQIQYLSGIEDYALRFDFDYMPVPSHKIRFGANGTLHTFKPGVSAFRTKSNDNSANVDTTFGSGNLYAQEFSVYAEDDFRIGKRLKFNFGGHYSVFNVRDTTYHSVQPRLSARLLITDYLSLKASYTHMTQYLHYLTTSSVGLPTDLWLPATDLVPPQNAVQYASGIAINLPKNFEITVEGFYKEMDNLIEYKEGASFFSEVETGIGQGDSWEQKVEIGQGWSYGAEFLLQRKYGKFNGWIGYTLSWTNRQFENIAFGKVFPYRYDRRHDISIVLVYKHSEKMNFGATWVYGTGNAVTLAQQRYIPINYLENQIQRMHYGDEWTWVEDVEYYGERNNFRLPAYHRLDVGVNFPKEKKRGTRIWSISVYNAYNQKNPFFVDFNGGLFGEYNMNQNQRQLIKYSLFPIIPSVNFTFKFK